LGGFEEKSFSLIQKETPAYSVVSDMTGTSKGTGTYGQMGLKKGFLAANTPTVFGENKDETYPCPHLNIQLDL